MSGRAEPKPRVWITRAQPGADATARRVRALGWEPIVAPLIETRAVEQARFDLIDIDALAFTSAAGVRAFAGLRAERGLPVFAVGHATAKAAADAGFPQVISADGDVRALAAGITSAAPRLRRILYPSAAEPSADLGALVSPSGVEVRRVAVYETVETDLAAAPENLAAVLVHSPRAASAVSRRLADRDLGATALIAISPAAARVLDGLGFRETRIADTPDEAALLARLGAAPMTAR